MLFYCLQGVALTMIIRPGKKPSIYCKENLLYSNVKSQAFIAEYFSNIDDLIGSIMEYKRVSNVPRDELTLADLLKEV